jgi:hypothetical protein
MFHTPLSVEAFQQLHHLQDSIANLSHEDQKDRWLCTGNSSLYLSRRHMYIWMVKNRPTQYTPRYGKQNANQNTSFFWMLLKDRLNTRSFLRRRSMPLDSYTCENCILQQEETILHLFVRCNFARRCWPMIGTTPPAQWIWYIHYCGLEQD